MPPRYSYWTIIAGGLPTAFRAAEKEELLPTFTRIKHKHPDAEMKWFARGKLWDSPETARSASRRREEFASRPSTPPRGRDWRPGGEHRDPRQKYRDAKTARNVEQRKRKVQRKRKFDGPGEKPRFDRRPLEKRFDKRAFPRNQRTDEPAQPTPPKPDRPNPEPRRHEGNEPTRPPRPSEPITTPPGPPERGRGPKRNRRR